MIKKGLLALGVLILIFVAFLAITSKRHEVEPEAFSSLFAEEGEKRDCGDDEYLLQTSAEWK